MKRLFFKGVFCALFLNLLFTSELFAKHFILNDDGILSQKVEARLNDIAQELFEKSGIFVGVGVFKSLDNASLYDKFKALDLREPYAFLIIAENEKKVDIFADDNTIKLFDKEAVLSPFPESGTILPILASKNGKDIYNAAILNGYADITERIAKSKKIELKTAIGNANKDTLNIFRVFVYGSMVFVFVFIIYRKKKRY